MSQVMKTVEFLVPAWGVMEVQVDLTPEAWYSGSSSVEEEVEDLLQRALCLDHGWAEEVVVGKVHC